MNDLMFYYALALFLGFVFLMACEAREHKKKEGSSTMMPKYRWQVDELMHFYLEFPQFFETLRLRHLADRT